MKKYGQSTSILCTYCKNPEKNVYVAIYDIFVERENISLKFKQNQIAILGSCHDVEGCIKRKKLTKLLFSEGFGDPL